MQNTNIHNGFTTGIIPAGHRDWQYRAYSNHLDSSQHFDLLTHGAAVYWLWLIDEIAGSQSHRFANQPQEEKQP